MVPFACSTVCTHWSLIASEEVWRASIYEAHWQAVYMQMLEQMLMACSDVDGPLKIMIPEIMILSCMRVHQHVLMVAQDTAAIPQGAG